MSEPELCAMAPYGEPTAKVCFACGHTPHADKPGWCDPEGKCYCRISPDCTPERHTCYGGACPWCCTDCNYADHRCHFCGDDLRHDNSRWADPPGTPNPCYEEARR
jgi:hypothetical protein